VAGTCQAIVIVVVVTFDADRPKGWPGNAGVAVTAAAGIAANAIEPAE
jgi:hypothetical protein